MDNLENNVIARKVEKGKLKNLRIPHNSITHIAKLSPSSSST
jgi:hypothetical protein